MDSVKTKIRSGWIKFRNLTALLASRGIFLETKDRFYLACVHNVLLYGSEPWPVQGEEKIRRGRNGARMVR